MMWVGDGKEVVMLLRKPRSKWYSLCCIGRKRHYRKDGTCKHVHEAMAMVKPELRQRVKIDPFGGRPGTAQEQHKEGT